MENHQIFFVLPKTSEQICLIQVVKGNNITMITRENEKFYAGIL